MTRSVTVWIVVLAIAAGALGLYLEHRRLNPPPPNGVTVADVGERPAEATFLTVDGKPRQLSDWRGKRLLINFWATWCAPCRREMPLLSENAARYRDRNVAIVGVAEDNASAVRTYLGDKPVSYPIVLADSEAQGGSLSFGNTRRVLPYSVLIGEDGRILRRKLGAFSQAELDEWLTPDR
ncbi:TlpA family protein disulfide reductase [Luteibacter flocculans]|uniref:TlpA family protein disulfide reductase n=1 Tax=Luteibacter flocculans TaxID=2780091 RepID=A0ABY4SZJ9_9GAMM|nr:TlpA disulfide reductase family protein [Luteibacter flocculans]URL58118.1 TlpA family protein disulfide reductase [Luteibacter flocculans]